MPHQELDDDVVHIRAQHCSRARVRKQPNREVRFVCVSIFCGAHAYVHALINGSGGTVLVTISDCSVNDPATGVGAGTNTASSTQINVANG